MGKTDKGWEQESIIIPVSQTGSWGTLVTEGLCCGFSALSWRNTVG